MSGSNQKPVAYTDGWAAAWKRRRGVVASSYLLTKKGGGGWQALAKLVTSSSNGGRPNDLKTFFEDVFSKTIFLWKAYANCNAICILIAIRVECINLTRLASDVDIWRSPKGWLDIFGENGNLGLNFFFFFLFLCVYFSSVIVITSTPAPTNQPTNQPTPKIGRLPYKSPACFRF